ncbi:MAG: RNA polymerase sigma factor [Chitinophagaceae bacterium]
MLYKHLYPLMIGICYRYGGDQDGAGIIFNNAMLRVFRNLERYQEQGAFLPWVKKIVVHAALDHIKQQVRFEPISSTENPLHATGGALEKLTVKEVKETLQLLPPATRTVCLLYWYEGYKHTEIAGLLGISEGTSKWHINQARKALARLLETK